MPGCSRLSIDNIVQTCKQANSLGIGGVALFPNLSDDIKDSLASERLEIEFYPLLHLFTFFFVNSTNSNGLLQRCIKEIKREVPELVVISDVAMDPYSSDGHDGFVDNISGEIVNDATIPILCKMAVSQAEAGADFVAPSDMMDGRIGAIRQALDDSGFQNVGINSYCTKYCSSFYGPFREALDSAPRSGDKKTYQMDPANSRQALIELELDEQEGADWIMVKPGLPYLDIVRLLKENSNLPISVYHVSGEYAMLKAAAAQGWLDYDK